MPRNFYKNIEYRERQSVIMKENWKKGVFDFARKREKRICAREGCKKVFEAIPSDPKVYCCKRCSGLVKNAGRGPMERKQKIKISQALTGRIYPERRNRILVPRSKIICSNPKCKKEFYAEHWMKRIYCSVNCAMAVVGGKPTSPKASRGKAGIRKDISDKIYFYSRWEANYARLQNYLGVEWEYEPKTFDLGSQSYTPDFYLPKFNKYIEVKNFLWKYSKIRDEKFRKLYPKIKLKLLLKEDYLKLENKYSHLIKNWEYKNSRFNII
jgi:hypothetical protein